VALRSHVLPVPDPSIKTEQVEMTIVLKDGRKLSKRIEHAVGSSEVPMSDSSLEAKFADLADGILPKPQIARLMEACWNVEKLPSAAAVAKAAVQS